MLRYLAGEWQSQNINPESLTSDSVLLIAILYYLLMMWDFTQKAQELNNVARYKINKQKISSFPKYHKSEFSSN